MTKKIKCAYHLCKKDVEESKAIERMLHFMHGILSKDEPRKDCSEACAEKDQMAHELKLIDYSKLNLCQKWQVFAQP